jgi:hypothetical protein
LSDSILRKIFGDILDEESDEEKEQPTQTSSLATRMKAQATAKRDAAEKDKENASSESSGRPVLTDTTNT